MYDKIHYKLKKKKISWIISVPENSRENIGANTYD